MNITLIMDVLNPLADFLKHSSYFRKLRNVILSANKIK